MPNWPTTTQVSRCLSSRWLNSRWPKFAVSQSVVAKIHAAHGGQVWNRESRWDWNYYRICFMLSKILQVDAWNQKYLPHFWAQKGPLLAIGATTRPVQRPNDHLLENQRYPELPQDMGDLWSNWVRSVWAEKWGFHWCSVKKCNPLLTSLDNSYFCLEIRNGGAPLNLVFFLAHYLFWPYLWQYSSHCKIYKIVAQAQRKISKPLPPEFYKPLSSHQSLAKIPATSLLGNYICCSALWMQSHLSLSLWLRGGSNNEIIHSA